METKINGDWDEYMRITSQKLKPIIVFPKGIDMRKHEYENEKTDAARNTHLARKLEEIFCELTKTFDYMPLKANVNISNTEIEELLNYRQTGKLSSFYQLDNTIIKSNSIYILTNHVSLSREN